MKWHKLIREFGARTSSQHGGHLGQKGTRARNICTLVDISDIYLHKYVSLYELPHFILRCCFSYEYFTFICFIVTLFPAHFPVN